MSIRRIPAVGTSHCPTAARSTEIASPSASSCSASSGVKSDASPDHARESWSNSKPSHALHATLLITQGCPTLVRAGVASTKQKIARSAARRSCPEAATLYYHPAPGSSESESNADDLTAYRRGKILRTALLAPGPRRRWERHVVRRRGADLRCRNRRRVIAEHLWSTGERSWSETDLPRQLRDRVGRALNGSVLSEETLEWFVSAFHLGLMKPSDNLPLSS